MKHLYISLVAALALGSAQAQVVFSVEAPAALEGNYTFTYADPGGGWGSPDLLIPANAVLDTAVFALDDTSADSLACDTIVNISEVTGKIAFVYRGTCNFSLKALMAQNAGAVACVVINNAPGAPIAMGAGTYGADVTIPVAMISQEDGALLAAEIQAGNVVVFIGNKQGLYDDDLGFYKKDVRMAKSTGRPKLVSNDGTEFSVEPGCWVTNFGNNDQTGVTVTATVGQGGTALYTETATAADIVSGDSAFFTFPAFTPSSWDGFYDMNYTINMSVADEYDGDNTFDASFLVDSLLAYGVVADSTNLPVSGPHYRPSTSTASFSSCIHFQDPNASRMAAMGISISATAATGGTMEGEFLETNAYTWEDPFTGLSDPDLLFDNVNVAGTGEYAYDTDQSGVRVYIPFLEPVMLEDDMRYLFCVTTYSATVYLGYDDTYDYDENITFDDQPICPINNDGTWFALGFGTDVTSAIGVVMGNFDVSVDENASNQVISAYPNPATDRVWLDIAGMTGAGDLIIRDAMGRQVGAQRMQLGSDRQIDLNVSELTNGAYLFELRDAAGKVRSFRVVVAR